MYNLLAGHILISLTIFELPEFEKPPKSPPPLILSKSCHDCAPGKTRLPVKTIISTYFDQSQGVFLKNPAPDILKKNENLEKYLKNR